jgi:hypothetical protein
MYRAAMAPTDGSRGKSHGRWQRGARNERAPANQSRGSRIGGASEVHWRVLRHPIQAQL